MSLYHRQTKSCQAVFIFQPAAMFLLQKASPWHRNGALMQSSCLPRLLETGIVWCEWVHHRAVMAVDFRILAKRGLGWRNCFERCSLKNEWIKMLKIRYCTKLYKIAILARLCLWLGNKCILRCKIKKPTFGGRGLGWWNCFERFSVKN